MILNGAVIRFKTRTRIELNTQARFLFGKQIMRVEEALTPLQKIYFALQQAYIGADTDRPAALAEARARIEAQRAKQPLDGSAEALGHILDVIIDGAGFEALKLARQLVRADAPPTD